MNRGRTSNQKRVARRAAERQALDVYPSSPCTLASRSRTRSPKAEAEAKEEPKVEPKVEPKDEDDGDSLCKAEFPGATAKSKGKAKPALKESPPSSPSSIGVHSLGSATAPLLLDEDDM